MMKKFPLLYLFMLSVVLAACSSDSAEPDPVDPALPSSVTYQLNSVAKPEVSGKVTFKKIDDGTTEVTLQLNGSSTDVHIGHIHIGNALGGGAVAITLLPIECDCENSITLVTKLDNGTAISYKELYNFDGYVDIHQSEDEMEVIIALGNIGKNANK
ncbi:hypothetical protein K8352_11105 [Flavobacteriaceae bacterium F89]|uniref:CHRD domain-containing protein n=1 Tax=Cerina litoralis TaxID=2874477 RepID=A0AAE3JT93_9FLAO|nr:hypothetical protein [Cerina litoralis]MCG2461297.1 hypothetical protein [Cerina litoralis]